MDPSNQQRAFPDLFTEAAEDPKVRRAIAREWRKDAKALGDTTPMHWIQREGFWRFEPKPTGAKE